MRGPRQAGSACHEGTRPLLGVAITLVFRIAFTEDNGQEARMVPRPRTELRES